MRSRNCRSPRRGAEKKGKPAGADRRAERRVLMRNLSQSEYRNDRVVVNTLRAAARVVGLPPKVLANLPRGELRRLVRRARGRAEREWHKASLRLDAVVALQDAMQEGRL